MILVTGGTGLVGAHLLYDLCKEGRSCRAIFRDEKGLEGVKNLFVSYGDSSLNHYQKIEWIKTDILDLEGLKVAFKDIQTVYHCAAHISFDPKDFNKLTSVNVQGTANMVNLALDFKVEAFCYVSSIAALGKSSKEKPITEDTHWNIEDPNVYALSKYHAELEVWRGIWEGLSAVIINPGVILGAGFWDKGSGKLFAFAQKGSAFYFPGGAGFVGVLDVVNTMRQAVKEKKWNERYVCVAEHLSYKRLFEHMSVGFNLKKPTKEIPIWCLEILWRLDFVKTRIFGGSRKITKHTVRGLRHIDTYSAEKSINELGISYAPVNKVIIACCQYWKQQSG